MAAEKDMTGGRSAEDNSEFHDSGLYRNQPSSTGLFHGRHRYCGKFVGNKGVGSGRCYRNDQLLILGFLLGLTAGFTVLTAQKFGAGDMESM